jgi:hypothetical protein
LLRFPDTLLRVAGAFPDTFPVLLRVAGAFPTLSRCCCAKPKRRCCVLLADGQERAQNGNPQTD